MNTMIHAPFLFSDAPTLGLKAAALRYASAGSTAAAQALTLPSTAASPRGEQGNAWSTLSARVAFVALKVVGTWAAQRIDRVLVAEGWRRHAPLPPGETLSAQESLAMLFDTARTMWSVGALYAYVQFLRRGGCPTPLHRLCALRVVPESRQVANSVRPPATDMFMRSFIWKELSVSVCLVRKLICGLHPPNCRTSWSVYAAT